MKRLFLLPLLLVVSLSSAGEVWVREGEKEVTIGNDYLILRLSKDRGWLMDRVEDKEGRIILYDAHIYTDWGIYPRGYVGSKEEKEGKLRIEREGEEIVAIAEGELKASGKRMEKPIVYKVKYKIGRGTQLKAEIELRPQMERRNVSAFLAHLFIIPSAKQWLVNSLDGIISEDIENISGRCWESRDEPLSLTQPFIQVLTKGGNAKIEFIRFQPRPQNIFLFDGGEGKLLLFIAFMDGGLQEIGGSLEVSYIIKWEEIRY